MVQVTKSASLLADVQHLAAELLAPHTPLWGTGPDLSVCLHRLELQETMVNKLREVKYIRCGDWALVKVTGQLKPVETGGQLYQVAVLEYLMIETLSWEVPMLKIRPLTEWWLHQLVAATECTADEYADARDCWMEKGGEVV